MLSTVLYRTREWILVGGMKGGGTRRGEAENEGEGLEVQDIAGFGLANSSL